MEDKLRCIKARQGEESEVRQGKVESGVQQSVTRPIINYLFVLISRVNSFST